MAGPIWRATSPDARLASNESILAFVDTQNPEAQSIDTKSETRFRQCRSIPGAEKVMVVLKVIVL